jgi:hypothetical protein
LGFATSGMLDHQLPFPLFDELADKWTGQWLYTVTGGLEEHMERRCLLSQIRTLSPSPDLHLRREPAWIIALSIPVYVYSPASTGFVRANLPESKSARRKRDIFPPSSSPHRFASRYPTHTQSPHSYTHSSSSRPVARKRTRTSHTLASWRPRQRLALRPALPPSCQRRRP